MPCPYVPTSLYILYRHMHNEVMLAAQLTEQYDIRTIHISRDKTRVPEITSKELHFAINVEQ